MPTPVVHHVGKDMPHLRGRPDHHQVVPVVEHPTAPPEQLVELARGRDLEAPQATRKRALVIRLDDQVQWVSWIDRCTIRNACCFAAAECRYGRASTPVRRRRGQGQPAVAVAVAATVAIALPLRCRLPLRFHRRWVSARVAVGWAGPWSPAWLWPASPTAWL